MYSILVMRSTQQSRARAVRTGGAAAYADGVCQSEHPRREEGVPSHTEGAHFAAEPVDRNATAAAVAASVSPCGVEGARSASQSGELGAEDAPTAAGKVATRREEATRPPEEDSGPQVLSKCRQNSHSTSSHTK